MNATNGSFQTGTTVKVPAESLTMLWEFQVFYTAGGELKSHPIRARNQEEARFHAEAAGFAVTSIGTGMPVVDWNKPYFVRDEAKAFVMWEDSKFSKEIAEGKLQKCGGRSVYSRAELTRYMERGQG
jgi:hypothetical protein